MILIFETYQYERIHSHNILVCTVPRYALLKNENFVRYSPINRRDFWVLKPSKVHLAYKIWEQHASNANFITAGSVLACPFRTYEFMCPKF